MSSAFKFMSLERCLQLLQTRRVRFTPPSAFNDPFEAWPNLIGRSSPKSIREINRKLAGGDKQLFKHLERIQLYDGPLSLLGTINMHIDMRIGILSLSRNVNEPLLWAHYADNHRGVAVEFDLDHEFFADKTRRTVKYPRFGTSVVYSPYLPKFRVSYVKEKRKEYGDPTFAFPKDGPTAMVRDRHPLFYTKNKVWAYEREWRMVRRLREPLSERSRGAWSLAIFGPRPLIPPVTSEQLIRVPSDAIRSIVLGARANKRWGEGAYDVIRELLVERDDLAHVKIFEVRLHLTKHEVVVFDPSDPEHRLRNIGQFERQARFGDEDW